MTPLGPGGTVDEIGSASWTRVIMKCQRRPSCRRVLRAAPRPASRPRIRRHLSSLRVLARHSAGGGCKKIEPEFLSIAPNARDSGPTADAGFSAALPQRRRPATPSAASALPAAEDPRSAAPGGHRQSCRRCDCPPLIAPPRPRCARGIPPATPAAWIWKQIARALLRQGDWEEPGTNPRNWPRTRATAAPRAAPASAPRP